MAHPKRRHSSTRGKKRRTHDAATIPNVAACPSCGQSKTPHRACPSCGQYAGRQVVEIKPKKPKKKK